MIELRSDTFTLPTPTMREAIAQAVLGDDVYGEDPTVARLEELAASKLGKQASCLMPSGTMANLAALLAHCPRGSKVLVGNESDIFLYEAGGASVCGGLMYEPLATRSDGCLALADIEQALAMDFQDPQFAPPALLCLENTHNRCGGTVLPLAYLDELAHFARTWHLPIHMDGARLFHAAIALGVKPEAITRHVDSVQFCLSKGLSAPIGSIVAGDAAFIAQVRRIRKMLGGGMRQAGVIAAAGIIALEQMIERLAQDHMHARLLAEGLAQLPGIQIDLPTVQTNIALFRVVEQRFTWQTFLAAAQARGLALSELGYGRIRAVVHYGITRSEIDEALTIISAILRHGPDAH